MYAFNCFTSLFSGQAVSCEPRLCGLIASSTLLLRLVGDHDVPGRGGPLGGSGALGSLLNAIKRFVHRRSYAIYIILYRTII